MTRKNQNGSTMPFPVPYKVRTRDGWRIMLYRYTRNGHSRTLRHPVFLCHGLGANRYDLDAPGEMSLAKYLFSSGMDVWVVELRGTGRSSRSGSNSKDGHQFIFDDYIAHDIPAAFKFIASKVGLKGIHWVGHSMGGMLAYPILQMEDGVNVASATTVGSPSLATLSDPALDSLIKFRFLLNLIKIVPYGRLTSLASWLPESMMRFMDKKMLNIENIEVRFMRRLARVAIEDVPTSLIKQFLHWYRQKHFHSYYGNLSWRDDMHKIKAPIFLIAGSADGLTPAEDIKFIYDRVSSEKKKFMVFGRESGHRTDYGHVDLILGKSSRDEVWPEIRNWIQEND